VHAATVGLNVNFAKLATRAPIREHLGRSTYVAAASNALRERPAFDCELYHDGRTEKLRLSQLSVINAPIFGGALGMSVEGANPDDRLLDVLAVEDMPVRRMLLAALFLLLRIKRTVAGVHALHVSTLHARTHRPLDVALDGEVAANLACDFEVAGEALRVVTPQGFEDVDDSRATRHHDPLRDARHDAHRPTARASRSQQVMRDDNGHSVANTLYTIYGCFNML
jgi:diacylglycerol kinase family enzyme